MAKLFVLHITDPHLSVDPIAAEEIDRKLKLPGVKARDRKWVFEQSLGAVAEFLHRDSAQLAATLLGGDFKQGGKPTDPGYIQAQLSAKLGSRGWSPATTVAVPGNHDVKRGSLPSSADRYQEFVAGWREKGYKTPILDGVDGDTGQLKKRARTKPEQHALAVRPVLDGGRTPLVVIPLNSSNWSHTPVEEYAILREVVAKGLEGYSATAGERTRLDKLFDSLLIHDAAMVSSEQREAIAELLDTVRKGADEHTITVILTHHHLLPVSAAEEHKTTESLMNLGAVRQFLAALNVDIVIHGHKHTDAIYRDLMRPGGTGLDDEREILVISGGSYDSRGSPDHIVAPCRLIQLDGLPHAPAVTVLPIRVPLRGTRPSAEWVGTNQPRVPLRRRRQTCDCPIVLSGTSIDALYEEVKQTAAQAGIKDGARVLICHLDLSDNGASSRSARPLPFPSVYDSEIDTPPDWVEKLVEWWQQSASRSEERVPYIHGVRLHRYDGYIDQIKRIVAVLQSDPGRESKSVGGTMADAVAVLIDPNRDFGGELNARGYLAFCLAQFVYRQEGTNEFIDIVAYYRAQEYRFWWPVNVAELVHLLRKVIEVVGGKVRVGRVTTVTPIAQFSESHLTPTRVAIPLIDQLVDANPHLLGYMVDALLLAPRDRTKLHERCWRKWAECIKDIELSTQEHNKYGQPVALAGIRFVIERIEKSDQHHSRSGKRVLELFETIESTNSAFEKHPMDGKEFKKWSKRIKELLAQLRKLVEGRK